MRKEWVEWINRRRNYVLFMIQSFKAYYNIYWGAQDIICTQYFYVDLSLHIYKYIYMCVCVCVCIYIYIHTLSLSEIRLPILATFTAIFSALSIKFQKICSTLTVRALHWRDEVSVRYRIQKDMSDSIDKAALRVDVLVKRNPCLKNADYICFVL